MAGNSFGKIFTLTSFGESHGKAIGGVIEGLPAGLTIDMDFIQNELNRRRPGQSKWVSPRQEEDRFEILSGVFENITTGTPIGFVIWNKDQHSFDYDHLKNTYRPSHADYTYDQKYGVRDHRGGGRSSARETIARVVAGAFAKIFLKEIGVEIHAFIKQLNHVVLEKELTIDDLRRVDESPLRCPDAETTQKMIDLIEVTAAEGDTLGGVVGCVVSGMPKGLGAPVFDKLHADLGKAMLSINAVKGFEYGSGFRAPGMKGSEHNDLFTGTKDHLTTLTNHSGGVQGGISNGSDVYFNVAFKPIATVMKDQRTVDKEGNEIVLKGKGRHDVTVLPRAVPIVEAMAAMVLVDHYLLNRLSTMKDVL
ncbi:MAG: chorismate synthase [Bacteroidales bacterium]|nr:chorismate synthase [Bacteroidales bacterium]